MQRERERQSVAKLALQRFPFAVAASQVDARGAEQKDGRHAWRGTCLRLAVAGGRARAAGSWRRAKFLLSAAAAAICFNGCPANFEIMQ